MRLETTETASSREYPSSESLGKGNHRHLEISHGNPGLCAVPFNFSDSWFNMTGCTMEPVHNAMRLGNHSSAAQRSRIILNVCNATIYIRCRPSILHVCLVSLVGACPNRVVQKKTQGG